MTEKASQILADHSEMKIRKNYSGRGMFGKTTCGVIGTRQEFFSAVASVLREGSDEEQVHIAEAVEDLAEDGMGRDSQIFY